METNYIEFQTSYQDQLIHFYMDYYNSKGGAWTYEKAFRRIHQIAAMEDSLILLQFAEQTLVGFLMGYFKEFDDSTGFYLEEILVSSDYQHMGYGSDFLSYLKSVLKSRTCNWIELLTTTSPLHQNFYRRNGFSQSENLILEYIDLI